MVVCAELSSERPSHLVAMVAGEHPGALAQYMEPAAPGQAGRIYALLPATGLLIFSTDQLFAALIPGFKAMTTPPLYYFLISVVTDALYSIIGGFLCARIAHPPFRRNAMFSLILLGELVGVVSTIFLWKIVPHWWSFALLLLYPPAVWLGFKLQSRQTRLHQAAA